MNSPLFPPFVKGDQGGFLKDMLLYNKKLKGLSRTLRKNMTDAERLVWSKIRGKQLRGYQFYRQKIIGNYIVDFYCPAAQLIIEIDGGQHYSEKGTIKDKVRDNYMFRFGLKVLRFSDREVLKNMDGVLKRMYKHLRENPPQSPFRKGGWPDFPLS